MNWVEAVPIRSTTAELICQFILDNIISRFGIPSTLISNNGISFKNKDVKKFLKKYHIQHHFSTPYYPQSNGQDECSNEILEQVLRKIVNKKWKGLAHLVDLCPLCLSNKCAHSYGYYP